MMPSSLDDEDEFSVNPFRTSAGGIAMTSTAPPNRPAADDPFYSHPPSQQQQQQQSAPQGPPQWSQQASAPSAPTATGPDPHSGMTGSFSPMMAPAPPQQPTPIQQQASQQQQQYLSGTMDRRHDEIQSTHVSWLYRCTSCFRIEGYQPYFDLDTAEFLQRFQASLTVWWQPDGFRTTFLREDKPDLYGPLWIVATLVFVLAATSNMASWAAYPPPSSASPSHSSGGSSNSSSVVIINQAPAAEFEYDIHRLLRAATVLATFFWGYPSFLWLACACLGIPHVTWPMWMAVYGYSASVYLFAFVICVVPWGLMRFIVLAGATFMSCLLVLRNVSSPLLAHDAMDQAKASPIILSMMGAHFVLLLVLKFGFFG
jgi:protein YIPF1/2